VNASIARCSNGGTDRDKTNRRIEMDEERDRKACLALDLKVTSANRELAQWLVDHPRYSAALVSRWLSCGDTRIKQLRRWAASGFCDDKHPTAERRRYADNRDRPRAADAPLETNDNSDDEAEVAPPEQIEDNLNHYLDRMNHFAKTFKYHFKLSSFDREAEARMITAIDRMIEKWRSTQATLTRRGHPATSRN